ncbi:MAG: hypothetical protein ABIA66_03840 [Candidatus Omnitrophota bacterium]
MIARKRGFMFIEPLLVVAIIMFVLFQLFKVYFKKPSVNKDAQKFIGEQGIDTANHKTITDSTRKQIQDLQSKYEAQLKQLDDLK